MSQRFLNDSQQFCLLNLFLITSDRLRKPERRVEEQAESSKQKQSVPDESQPSILNEETESDECAEEPVCVAVHKTRLDMQVLRHEPRCADVLYLPIDVERDLEDQNCEDQVEGHDREVSYRREHGFNGFDLIRLVIFSSCCRRHDQIPFIAPKHIHLLEVLDRVQGNKRDVAEEVEHRFKPQDPSWALC